MAAVGRMGPGRSCINQSTQSAGVSTGPTTTSVGLKVITVDNVLVTSWLAAQPPQPGVPQLAGAQGARIANDNQATLGASECHIQAPGILQEADRSAAVGPHRAHDDHLFLPALEPVHSLDLQGVLTALGCARRPGGSRRQSQGQLFHLQGGAQVCNAAARYAAPRLHVSHTQRPQLGQQSLKQQRAAHLCAVG